VVVVARPPSEKGPAVRVPPLLIAVLGVGLVLGLGSAVLGLSDRIPHWGKLLHAVAAGCFALVFGLLLLGFRDAERIDLSAHLAGMATILVGMTFGSVWEIVEFSLDWVLHTDLQTSNPETMLDLLFGVVGGVTGGLVALRTYHRGLGDRQRKELGTLADWLWAPAARLLDERGGMVAMLALLALLALIGALWVAGGRYVPGLPFD
jgi:hypothetical protein